MNKIIDIGSAPLFRGEYNAKSVYYNDNVVTMCGCVFIGLVNEISGIPPLTKQSNGTLVFSNTNCWNCVVDNLDLYNAAPTAYDAAKHCDQTNNAIQDAERTRVQNENYRIKTENERQALINTKVQNAVAKVFTDYYNQIETKIREVERAIEQLDSIGNPASSIPVSIFVTSEITAYPGVTIDISPKVFVPNTCNKSCVYQIYSGNGVVTPDGKLSSSSVGDVQVYVIPALASGAYQLITVHFAEPTPLQDETGAIITDDGGNNILA